ncbi:MAG: PAS domain S-box protein [Capsulimonadaceae bacterium]|nr:PAS domain S-box protein [Capsulimonadaceae bacterium]
MSWASERFAELFQDLPVICFSYDKDGIVYEWNRACEQESGFSADQVLQRPVWETFGQRGDEAILRKMAADVCAGKTYANVEMVLVRADLTTYPVINSTFPIRGGDGTVAGIISANINIEERKEAERALRESEERLKLAMDVAQLRSFEWDLVEDFVRWTEADAARMGLSQDCLGMPGPQFLGRVHPEDQPQCYAALNKGRSTKSQVEVEYRTLRSDGSIGWTLTRGTYIADKNGEAVKFLGTALDITASKEAEILLRQAQELLEVRVMDRTEELSAANEALKTEIAERKRAEEDLRLHADIVEHIKTGLLVYHMEDESDEYSFRLSLSNQSAHEQGNQGYQRTVGRYIRDIYPPNLLPTVVEHFNRVVRTGQSSEVEDFAYAEDGSIKFAVKANMFPLPNRCVGVALENLTQRRRAERELQRAYAENAHILASIASILICVDAKDAVTSWNTMAEQAFGIQRGEAIGCRFMDLGIQWDWEPVVTTIRECQTTDEPLQLDDLHYTAQDGRERFLAVTINPLKDGNGQASGYLFLGTDITKRKVMESQLAQAQKLEAIGSLAAGIAHEINTPIQYVGDNTRFLNDAFQDLNKVVAACRDVVGVQDQGKDIASISRLRDAMEVADIEYITQEIPAAIDQSLEGVERVANIVRAMKEFSHPGQEEITAIDLNHSIESTITVARNEWKYVAEVKTDFEDNLRPVPCYPGAFNQVILNMIVNAAHAVADVVAGSNNMGLITVSTREEAGLAVIRISDTGTGMPPEVIARIYDPFFTTKPVGRGTGQGLAISHTVIVEKHHGTIDVTSETGHGTTFTIRLPIDRRGS